MKRYLKRGNIYIHKDGLSCTHAGYNKGICIACVRHLQNSPELQKEANEFAEAP